MEKTTDGRIFLRGELGHTDVPTSNNRVYTKEVIEREISKLQKEAKGNKLYGELDHPADGRTQFQRVSHIIRDLHVAPNGAIVGELELLGTARGNDLAAIIKAGGAVGVSSRGTGTTHKREDGVDVVNDDYTLITYDVVADPAHSGAYPDVFFEWNVAKNLGRVEMSDSEKDVKDVAAPASEPAAQTAAPAADAPAEKPEGEMITVEACSAQTADAVQKAMEGMREQVRAEEREAIKEQVQKELTSQVESMKKEALESARSEILSDPKVADAKNRLAAIRSILGSSDESLVPKEENDKLAATLKERDEQIAALSAKVSEFEKKITEANAEKAKLAETARRSFVKSYVEKRISDLPDKELVLLPKDHPIFRAAFPFPGGLPKIHEHDGLPAQAFAIFHEGRMVVFYSYQSDLGDGWEDPSVHNDPEALRIAALRMGVNIVTWALSH
jgi:hypothetical protein